MVARRMLPITARSALVYYARLCLPGTTIFYGFGRARHLSPARWHNMAYQVNLRIGYIPRDSEGSTFHDPYSQASILISGLCVLTLMITVNGAMIIYRTTETSQQIFK